MLYPALLRDLLVELAVAGLFRGRWTADIHGEWMRSVLKNRPDLTEAQLHRTRELMDQSVMDCLVEGYQDVMRSLILPDPDDRHVLAAAIVAGADSIVTFNAKDFPAAVMGQYGIEVQHPDTFLRHQLGLDDAKVLIAVQRCRSRLKSPPYTADQYLERLERQSLPLTVAALRPYADVL